MGHITLIQSTAYFSAWREEEVARITAEVANLRAEIKRWARKEADSESADLAKKLVANHKAILVGPVAIPINGGLIVTLLPEGSKRGWDAHDCYLGWRERLDDIALSFHGTCTHVILEGQDEEESRLVPNISHYIETGGYDEEEDSDDDDNTDAADAG